MELFFDLLEILGHWLVFSFSLYEGLMNLAEHADVALKYESRIVKMRLKFWERIIMPLYFYRLKENVMQIMAADKTPAPEVEEMLKLIDRAILWIYLSIGGWLVWLSALYSLMRNRTDIDGIFVYIGLAALGTLLSYLNVHIRIKKRRQRTAEIISTDPK